MNGPVRPEKTLEQWNPVSQKLSLYEVQIDYQGDLRQHQATVDSRADGSAFAWQKIGRRDARGAKPALGHLISVEGQGVTEQMEQEIELIVSCYGLLTRVVGVFIVLKTLVQMGLAFGVVECVRGF